MRVDIEQLKAFLLDANMLKAEDFAIAETEAKSSGKRVEDVLLDKSLIKEEELVKMKAYILGIPFVNLEREKIPQDVLHIIPEPIAKNHHIVAYRKEDDCLEVAMLDPEDLQTVEFIKKKAGIKILPRLTSSQSIKNVLSQYQKTLSAEFGEFIKKDAEIVMGSSAPVNEKGEADDLPIIRIVDTLIKHAVLQKASDIHIEPLEKEVIIRYRIDGNLHEAMILPIQVANGIVAHIKVLANLKIDEHRLPQDGRFKKNLDGQEVSFRVSILPVYDGEKIVMRVLLEDAEGFNLEGLGLRGEPLEIVHRQIQSPHGLILVTGPTGSGKTTTLYTVLEMLNTPEVNICTIEDPIEYRMVRVNQTQVNPKIGLTFANGLRSLVRQDPDIIMVGEIRDSETASLAINAALTGHLVLSTLHTNSASGTLPRLIDMEVEPFLIASTVNVIIAERLVRKLYADSRVKYRMTAVEVEELGKIFNLDELLFMLKKQKIVDEKIKSFADIDFYKPGKSEDAEDGYKGRIGIFEVLQVTDPVRELIIKRASADEINDYAKKTGMISMLEDGFTKAVQGITSIEEILRATKD